MIIDRDENGISLELPSDLRLVDQLVEDVRGFAKECGVERAPGLGLILRELVNNAIEHGNRSEQERKVGVRIESAGPMRFKVVVEDQGAGFEYESLDLRLSEDPNQERNRGLPMVNAYADELVFDKGGTRATAYVTVKRDTLFETVDEDGIRRIIPSGDLSSSVAEPFRSLLVGLLEQGLTRFRFDLTNVTDIDSVALSIFVIFANMVAKSGDEGLLEVVNANGDIREMFHLTRLSRIYSVIEEGQQHGE
ncbi:ATP-binding protein [Paucidesulfovibrio longus]|uniref:ATP-binding protein n=1 Tax=Paucidesulfovibrio longus TaxID=889 RepID=UPI0003B5C2D9|nr:ATP-binding protein [Paucidesulfovibrio longus]